MKRRTDMADHAPLPWERLLWSARPLPWSSTRYLLTDFRLVVLDGDRSDELAVDDIRDVHRSRTRLDRLLARSTLVIDARSGRRPPIVLHHVRQGTQLAALLEFLARSPSSLDGRDVEAALAWEPRFTDRRPGRVLGGTAALLI